METFFISSSSCCVCVCGCVLFNDESVALGTIKGRDYDSCPSAQAAQAANDVDIFLVWWVVVVGCPAVYVAEVVLLVLVVRHRR